MMSGSWRRMLRSECAERQTDLGMHLDLVDAVQLVFHRVLGGDDLGLVALDFQERAVKRGALAGTGGAGDEDDPVRQLDQLAELGVQVRLHAQLAELEFHGPLVQQAHDDSFAVDHGDHGDADIDLASAGAELDAAVLRQPPLGNVQPRHDLQTADDRGLEAVDLRRHRLGVQHAVDAIADPQARLLRFNVHVAGPQLDRLQQDLVDQPHHRGFLGHLREFGIVVDRLIEFDAVVGLPPRDRRSFRCRPPGGS